MDKDQVNTKPTFWVGGQLVDAQGRAVDKDGKPKATPTEDPDAAHPDTTSAQRITELEGQVRTLTQERDTVQSSLNSLRQEHDNSVRSMNTIGAQLTTVTQERDEARAAAATPEDAQALSEYRELYGELTPPTLAPKARASLIKAKLATKGVLAQTPDQTLIDLADFGQKSLEAARAWAPYSGPEQPQGG